LAEPPSRPTAARRYPPFHEMEPEGSSHCHYSLACRRMASQLHRRLFADQSANGAYNTHTVGRARGSRVTQHVPRATSSPA
jgi:hypothetical protein